MDAERWKRVDSLLEAAQARPPDERDAFLRQTCVNDEALEREIVGQKTSKAPRQRWHSWHRRQCRICKLQILQRAENTYERPLRLEGSPCRCRD